MSGATPARWHPAIAPEARSFTVTQIGQQPLRVIVQVFEQNREKASEPTRKIKRSDGDCNRNRKVT